MAISSIAGIVRTHGRARPTAPALHFEGRTLSFGELDERSSRLANALAGLGVGRGHRVAYLDRNGPAYFELSFALGKLGAVNVAVNWRLTPGEIAQIVDDARAEVMVVGPELVPHVEKIEDELATLRSVLALGGHDRWLDYEQAIAAADATDPGVEPGADEIAVQLYTSGTTGLPKGVMLSNDNFFHGPIQVADTWGLAADSVNLCVMPMFHIAGSGWAFAGLYHGAHTVLLRDVDPLRILELVPELGVTNALFVPAVIQFLLGAPTVEQTDFSTLRSIVYGASPITETVLRRALTVFGCELVQVYGLTETTGAITQLDGADHDPEHRPELLRSCGRPYPWIDVRVVDPASGEDVPVGQVGELWTRSRQNMVGYWGNEEATRAALTDDGWLRTGDAGYRDADGYLFLHDRIKDMIVSGGENVYPAEVENVLARHPDVVDVAVIGVPDETWGEAVKAVVVRRDGAAVTGPEIIAFAREHLAGFKLPKSVDFAPQLPRNPSGKLLKREIRAPYWVGHTRRIG
jgi:long-chain acyl-CoA synthetase